MRPLVAGFYSRIEDQLCPVFCRRGVLFDTPEARLWWTDAHLGRHVRTFQEFNAPRESRVTLAQSQFFLSMVGKHISCLP